MSERSLPSGNLSMTPPDGFIDEQLRKGPNDTAAIMSPNRIRWILERDGDVVMWGEGKVQISFEAMLEYDHDVSGYELVCGKGVGAVPADTFEILTPTGETVGEATGIVSHNTIPSASSDVRAKK